MLSYEFYFSRHSSADEEFDSSIDLKLKQSAMRNNLTPQNVKNILQVIILLSKHIFNENVNNEIGLISQKVVRNDHVLAVVKLKAEDLERRELAMKDPITAINISAEESNNKYDDEEAVPKLTRAKAKALNKYPLPVAPLQHSEPDSEVVALIREELHSDDDDDEYQPGEDDIEVQRHFITLFIFLLLNTNTFREIH